MIKRIMRVLLLPLFIISLFSIGNAQRTTITGVINGTVIDDQGLPLPGVEVTATSPSLMLPQVSALTDDEGFFRFPELPTGYYEVSFSLSGFKTVVQERAKVDFNKTISLNVKMELATIEEEIIVIAEAPLIDKASSSVSVTLETNILRHVPSARDFSKGFEMVPGVVNVGASYVGIGVSVHGSSFRDNSYNTDGINFSDPVGGANFTRVGWEIAEEYQVETTGHAAEYGGVRGGVFNIITKSGGNHFSGELNFYYSNKSLLADNTKGTPFEGQFVGFKNDVDTTFQLGGPIVKDKLWIFANLSYQKREDYVQGYPHDKSENTPSDTNYLTPYIKLSWQINPSMKLVGSWDYPPKWYNHRGASWQRNEDTTWNRLMVCNKFSLIYSWIINENLIFSSKVGAMFFDLSSEAKNDSPRYYDLNTRTITGSYSYSDYYKDTILHHKSDLAYFVKDFFGRHEFKTGFEYQYTYRHRRVVHNYDENGLGPYIYTRGGVPERVMFAQDFDPEEKMNIFGLFVQDRWNPTKRLTLNLGLRYDYQEGIIPAQGEDRAPVTYGGKTYSLNLPQDVKPIIWNTLSPRLGASYDLTGDGKTILKASFSIYYLENIINYFTRTNPNGSFNRYYHLNPDWSLGDMYRFYITSAASIDPDLKPSVMTEIVIGIQREFLPNLVLSATYIRKQDRNCIEDIVLEALDLDAIKAGNYVWSGYTPVTAVDPYDGKTVTFFNRSKEMITESRYTTNPEPSKKDYSGFELVLDKKFSHNWLMQLSYVYSKPTGLIGIKDSESNSYQTLFNNPNMHINAIGRFTHDIRHQFKIIGTVEAPLGILIGTYFRAYAGARYTRKIRSLDLGLKLNQGTVTINAEERGSRGLPWRFIWDMRLEKKFKIASLPIFYLTVDCFNVLNQNAVTSVETLSSTVAQFEIARSIMDPRSIRLGIRMIW